MQVSVLCSDNKGLEVTNILESTDELGEARYVNNANTRVTEILPVRFAPNGKIGISPIRLFIRMKKNAVSRYGENFR